MTRMHQSAVTTPMPASLRKQEYGKTPTVNLFPPPPPQRSDFRQRRCSVQCQRRQRDVGAQYQWVPACQVQPCSGGSTMTAPGKESQVAALHAAAPTRPPLLGMLARASVQEDMIWSCAATSSPARLGRRRGNRRHDRGAAILPAGSRYFQHVDGIACLGAATALSPMRPRAGGHAPPEPRHPLTAATCIDRHRQH
jgi:hypothetical protein